MAYDVNTSKTHRLPINFFYDMYEDIPELESYVYEMQEQVATGGPDEPILPLLVRVLDNIKRQRMSHRGNEEL